MADKFLEYMGKPLVRSGDEIYYGDMNDIHIVKFTILSKDAEENPNKINIKLLKSDTNISEKDRIVKESTKDSMFEALDVGFVWLDRALKWFNKYYTKQKHRRFLICGVVLFKHCIKNIL